MISEQKSSELSGSKEFAAVIQNKDSYLQAHLKLGHPSQRMTLKTSEKLGWKVNNEAHSCANCQQGKAKQKNTKKKTERKAKEKGEQFYINLSWIKVGGRSAKKKSQRRFWLLVVDDFTKMKWSFF